LGQIIPFILCAGKGTRLRPLTDRVPKPLIPFFGKAILDYAIDSCMELQPKSIFVNSHYLDHAIFSHVNNLCDEVRSRITISFEPTILGSGGCLSPLVPLAKGSEILIHNGDIIHDIHVLQFVEAARLRPNAPAVAGIAKPHRAGTSSVYFSPDLQLRSFKAPVLGADFGTFSGVHLLRRSFLDEISDLGEFSSIDIYERLLNRGFPAAVNIHDGIWFDLGLPAQLLDAHIQVLESGTSNSLLKRRLADRPRSIFVDEGESKTIKSLELNGPCFIEDSKVLEIGSGRIGPNVSVSGRTKFGENCKITNSVLHDFEVGSNGEISKSLCYWNIDLKV